MLTAARQNVYMNQSLYWLREDFLNNKPVVIFAGAGINLSPKLDMSWNSVLDFLFSRTLQILAIRENIPSEDIETILSTASFFRYDNTDYSNERKELYALCQDKLPMMIKASIIKQVFNGDYISEVQSFLYGNEKTDNLKQIFEENYSLEKLSGISKDTPFHTLYQIARLIVMCPNVKAVVTYNYDNFLSQAINILLSDPCRYFSADVVHGLRNMKVVDIYGSNSGFDSEEDSKRECCYGDSECGKIENVYIYHPHGYIPPLTEIISSKPGDIVLSMDEYYENSRNVYSWQTSTQLHFLCHYVCVFAGFSFNDINVQRLIYYARSGGNKNKIYYLYADNRNGSRKDRYGRAYDAVFKIVDSFYVSYGLTTVYCPEGWHQLYTEIGKIADDYVRKN